MTIVERQPVPLHHVDRLFIGGTWVEPSSEADRRDRPRDRGAVPPGAGRRCGRCRPGRGRRPRCLRPRTLADPQPRRAGRLPAPAGQSGGGPGGDLGQIWPRESGALYTTAVAAGQFAGMPFDTYAALADTFPFEERAQPTMGGAFGLLVREPVGVVGAIIPWNAPVSLISHKIGPALLAGCTVVLKLSPEAPGVGYLVAEAAEAVGLPPGVLNVITADREVSELLVRDPGVDKITFTGSTAAGRRIASLCGERIARFTLELGGKSAAVILDDADLEASAQALARPECFLTGQVCSSLTRIVVPERRHDEFVDALARELRPRCGSVTRSTRRPRWAPWPSAANATGSRATSPRASAKGRSWSPAAAARVTSTGAGSSSPRCSPGSTTRRPSPRRRSSARS